MKINDEQMDKIVGNAEMAVDIVESIGVGFVTEAAVTKMLMPLMPSVGAKILVGIGAAALAHTACTINAGDNGQIGEFTKAFWALRNAVKEASEGKTE